MLEWDKWQWPPSIRSPSVRRAAVINADTIMDLIRLETVASPQYAWAARTTRKGWDLGPLDDPRRGSCLISLSPCLAHTSSLYLSSSLFLSHTFLHFVSGEGGCLPIHTSEAIFERNYQKVPRVNSRTGISVDGRWKISCSFEINRECGRQLAF